MPPLIVVQNDAEHRLVKRRGRFTVPAAIAASADDIRTHGLEAYPHLLSAVIYWRDRMLRQLADIGYHHRQGTAFDLVGPQPHIHYSDDTRPDPGVLPPPNLGPDPGERGLDLLRKHQLAEAAMAARRLGEQVELADYELVGQYWHKIPTSFRSSNFPLGSVVLDPQQPLHPAMRRHLAQRFPQLAGTASDPKAP